jgi:pyruvate formate lyase activating enzyme
MKEALLYKPVSDRKVQCRVCSNYCVIPEGEQGECGVRENRDGVLYSLTYGKLVALNVDPIEKKPLFHFFPGANTLSVAAAGCSLKCRFCQNHLISQVKHHGIPPTKDYTPEEVIEQARELQTDILSYTYSEPTVNLEFCLETMKLARAEGMKNVWISNGFMSGECLAECEGLIDAVNIDLKSFQESVYRELLDGRLAPVVESIRALYKMGVWVEVTTLVIPGVNDSDEELKEIASFLLSMGPEIPWHVSAFHPDFQFMDVSRTPGSTIQHARNVGLKTGLRYVYCGNYHGSGGENTSCHACGTTLIERWGFQVISNHAKDGQCPKCRTQLAGHFG